MERALHAALLAARKLEHKLMKVASDGRLLPAERSQRVTEIMQSASGEPLSAVWAAAGHPAPLGFAFNERADHAEWFDAWFEVESVVLEGEEKGYSRKELERMILRNEEPFDVEFEAEDLGIIHRTNESRHTD